METDDVTLDDLLREIQAVTIPPAGAFTVEHAHDLWLEKEPDLSHDAAGMRLRRDKHFEQWGMYQGVMYYRVKDD